MDRTPETIAAAKHGKPLVLQLLAGQNRDNTVDLAAIYDALEDARDAHGDVLGWTMLLAAATEQLRDGLMILHGTDADLAALIDEIAARPTANGDTNEAMHHLAVLLAADRRGDAHAWGEYLSHVINADGHHPYGTTAALLLAATSAYTYHLTRNGLTDALQRPTGWIHYDPDTVTTGTIRESPREGVAARLARLLRLSR